MTDYRFEKPDCSTPLRNALLFGLVIALLVNALRFNPGGMGWLIGPLVVISLCGAVPFFVLSLMELYVAREHTKVYEKHASERAEYFTLKEEVTVRVRRIGAGKHLSQFDLPVTVEVGYGECCCYVVQLPTQRRTYTWNDQEGTPVKVMSEGQAEQLDALAALRLLKHVLEQCRCPASN